MNDDKNNIQLSAVEDYDGDNIIPYDRNHEA
jgi:hypothetical protein